MSTERKCARRCRESREAPLRSSRDPSRSRDRLARYRDAQAAQCGRDDRAAAGASALREALVSRRDLPPMILTIARECIAQTLQANAAPLQHYAQRAVTWNMNESKPLTDTQLA